MFLEKRQIAMGEISDSLKLEVLKYVAFRYLMTVCQNTQCASRKGTNYVL